MPAPKLLSPAEAERIVLDNVSALPAEDCPVTAAHGRVLRTPLRTDRDLPPYDRVTMDGYALRATAVAAGLRSFRVAGLQAAGMMAMAVKDDRECIEIATGAVLPRGADCVVPYEDAHLDGESLTLAEDAVVTLGQNVHRQGSDFPSGTELVDIGTRVTGREIAVATSCGYGTLTVGTRPSVAVVATGDELVEVDTPLVSPQQIRKSNDYAVRAALLATGAASRVQRFHLRDLRYEVEERLRHILAEFDVVLLTGGISKGKFDFVPEALAKLGVTKKLQGVAQRPGKPFWFGLSPRHTPVFALPGNPVSTYTCLHRYVLPALDKMAGATPLRPDYVALSAPVSVKPSLAFMLPVVVTTAPDGRRAAEAHPVNTSGDFGGLVGTDGFVELPAGPVELAAGTVVRFWRWS